MRIEAQQHVKTSPRKQLLSNMSRFGSAASWLYGYPTQHSVSHIVGASVTTPGLSSSCVFKVLVWEVLVVHSSMDSFVLASSVPACLGNDCDQMKVLLRV